MNRTVIGFGATGLLALAGLNAHAALTTYTCTHLATEGGHNIVEPYAINRRGVAVGCCSYSNQFSSGATLWKGNGQTVELHSLSKSHSVSYDVNDQGQIVGYGMDDVREQHALVWSDHRAVPHKLIPLPDGVAPKARALNNKGHIVGTSGIVNNTTNTVHAVLWRDGRVIDLGTLGGRKGQHLKRSEARDINAAGVIVGTSDADRRRTPHAVRWDNPRTIVDLGTLPGTDLISHAVAINSTATIVGHGSYQTGDLTNVHAIAWHGGAVIDLGALPGDGTSRATALNDEGVVVGFSRLDYLKERAVIWYGLDQPPVDLNTLLSAGGCIDDEGEPYPLHRATSINSHNEILVMGMVRDFAGDPKYRIFRLKPVAR